MPLPFPYSVRWRWTLWGLKEKLKKPLINPWRLNYARYRQDFSSASFLEQEHAAVFLLQLFPGNSPVPRGGSKAFSKAFLGGERVAAREASLLSQGSEQTRSPLQHFPDQRRLVEAPTCWEETFQVQGQVCLSSILTDKLLCNIQEVTFIRLDSIYKIKSMEKQILVLGGKCWH